MLDAMMGRGGKRPAFTMCDLCSSGEPSVHVQLRHNVGMLFMRREYETQGRLCSSCLGQAFRKHQLSNLFLGWWGTISFIMTFVFLIDNVRAYIGARRDLARLAERKEASRVVPEGSPGERLAPFQHNVRLRLRRDEPASTIAVDLAALHQVPLADAEAFVQSIENEAREAREREARERARDSAE
jgi:hypothetical protein